MNHVPMNPWMRLAFMFFPKLSVFLTIALVGTQVLAANVERVNLGDNGIQADDNSDMPIVDAAGTHVAFESRATNLVAGDSNSAKDIFVRSLDTGITERISIATDGTQANGDCTEPAISADGRFVSFLSTATNLAGTDSSANKKLFVFDRVLKTTTLLTVTVDQQNLNGASFAPQMSADGRYLVFHSYASNLVSNDTNNFSDVFLLDRGTVTVDGAYTAAATLTRLSENNGIGGDGHSRDAAISPDGNWIAFASSAGNLLLVADDIIMDIFLHERLSGSRSNLTATGNGNSSLPRLSNGASHVVFSSQASNLVANDSNGVTDIFKYTRSGGEIVRVSQSGTGTGGSEASGRASISQDGSLILYESMAGNLASRNVTSAMWAQEKTVGNLFDAVSAATGTGGSGGSVQLPQYIYLYADSGSYHVSSGLSGVSPNGSSYSPGISADGSVLVYASVASNMVCEDSNEFPDVFRRLTATVMDGISMECATAEPTNTGSSKGGSGQISWGFLLLLLFWGLLHLRRSAK